MVDSLGSDLSLLFSDWSAPLSPVDNGRLLDFIRVLLEWNVRINVTGARERSDVVGEHFPDSLALFSLVPAGSRLVDVGSGGGLPAIPFAILRPDCQVTLVEPRAKRVAFLKTAVRVCKCSNVLVVRQRMEDCESHCFDVASSRATFPPLEWLASARELVVPGGRTIVLSTVEVSPRPSGLLLIGHLNYKTRNGSVRWAGSYCST